MLIVYLVLTRFSIMRETTLGITIGSVPIFLTDVALVLLLFLSALKRPWRLLLWVMGGTGAGLAGAMVWGICLMSVCWFLSAVPTYKLLAFRDLGVFGYAVFFPLCYMTIDGREAAVKLLRYFIYSVLVLGTALCVQVITGLPLGVYDREIRFVAGSAYLQRAPIGDLGSNLSFSLAALLAYIALEPQRRALNLLAAMICGFGIAASLSRSAVISLALGAVLTVLFLSGRKRLAFVVLGGVGGMMIFLAFRSGVSRIQSISLASVNALTPYADADFRFRLLRWRYALDLWAKHPILGIGFGVPLAPWDPSELGGFFNAGMPHNTYITVLARMGLVGLALVGGAIATAMLPLIRTLRKGFLNPDNLAATNVLVAMVAVAAFGLFFERPLLCGPFWIMLAVGLRLAETPSPALGSVPGFARSLQTGRKATRQYGAVEFG